MSARSNDDWKPVAASLCAKRTVNPIRSIVDNLKVEPNPAKEMISLALGDPTLFGNFKTPESAVNALIESVQSFKWNGYPPSIGYESARDAIARRYTLLTAPLTAKDVIIASGCSGALELCVSVIANEGQNLLLPRPGFSLYETLAASKGIECRYYNLLPERSWEIDLEHLTSLIDDKTAALIINNPSNPCGSVFSKDHLLSILSLAYKHKLPIISDEIYADIVFSPAKFHPIASLTDRVPILTVGGLAKQYFVPGWRVGWILIHDRSGLLAEIRRGLVSLSQLILGSNSLVQSVLPALLHQIPPSFYSDSLRQLEDNARFTAEKVSQIPGLRVVIPQGAMYMMVGIDRTQFKDISSDLEFTEKLVQEQSVLCLPGQCFKYPNYFRIVFTSPQDKLKVAYERLAEFCANHLRN